MRNPRMDITYHTMNRCEVFRVTAHPFVDQLTKREQRDQSRRTLRVFPNGSTFEHFDLRPESIISIRASANVDYYIRALFGVEESLDILDMVAIRGL